MKPQDLLSIIESDDTALQLATVGNDSACAVRCSDILPKVRVESVLTERGLYDAIGPEIAETVLQKLEVVAQQNPVVKRALTWLSPVNGGLDFGSLAVVGLLTQLRSAEVFTHQEFDALNAISMKNDIITTHFFSIFKPYV
jgi:hypothetical protein